MDGVAARLSASSLRAAPREHAAAARPGIGTGRSRMLGVATGEVGRGQAGGAGSAGRSVGAAGAAGGVCSSGASVVPDAGRIAP